jgi:cation diffusion facilitator family transporter
LERGKENLRIQSWILIVAVLLFALKIFAWYLTRSVAILTDALESTVNVIAGIVGFYSLYIASKPRDQNHPYGHGKAEFLSAAIEGTLIMVAGVFIIYEAIRSLIYPTPLSRLDTGILLVAFSALINFIVGFIAVKKSRKNHSAALEASGRHLQSDTYSTLAIIGGLLIIFFTGIHQLDSIIAITMSFVIMVIGYRIVRKSVAVIMDEADQIIVARMVEQLNAHRVPNWIDIHNFRVIKFGDILHVDCHMTVPWYLSVREAHHEIEIMRTMIEDTFGGSLEFFVHSDACIPDSCPICVKKDCPVRQHDFVKRIEWKMENIIPNKKHNLGSSA